MKQFFITSFLLLCLSQFVMENASASPSETIDIGTNVIDSFSDNRDKIYLDSLKSVLYKPLRKVHYDVADGSEAQSTATAAAKDATGNNHVPTSVKIDTSKAVGEIPITSGASQTGSKTYNVPIDMPEGMNGFIPGLSVAYDSHRGSTVVGKGWGLSGLSSITRTGRSHYHDNAAGGITMSGNDRFMIDGVRLISIQITNSYTVYQSEQGNIKAKCHKSGDVAKYFEVFYPDGRKGIFGFQNSQSNRLAYPMTSLEDMQGNTISYEYTLSNEVYHISKITYNGASVEFSYTTGRRDPAMSYAGGVEMTETSLLKSIICKSGGSILKTYSFTYEYQNDKDNAAINALLEKIECKCEDKSLNPLQFYYGTGATGESFNSSETLIEWGYESDDPYATKYVKGRFDYRSSSDGLIVLPNYNPYFKVYEEDTKNAKVTRNRFDNLYDGTENIYLYTSLHNEVALPVPNLLTERGFIDIFCADLKGQQEEYVVKVNNYVDNKRDKLIFTVYTTSFPHTLVKLYTRTYDMGEAFKDADGKWSVYPKFHYAGDFNGDGKMEVLTISADRPFLASSRNSECSVFDLENNNRLFQGQLCLYYVNFVATNQPDPVYSANYSDKLLVLDYDGDGKTDICHVNNGGLKIYTFDTSAGSMTPKQIAADDFIDMGTLFDRELLCGDFNGDGLTDLVASPSKKEEGNVWQLFFSKGNGNFSQGEFHSAGRKKLEKDNFIIQDIDGDGKTDLIRSDSVSLSAYMSRKNIPATEVFKSLAEKSVLVPTNINSHNKFSQLISIKDGVVTKYSFQKNNNYESLLTGMVNSHGVVERNNYALLNDPEIEGEVYIKGANSVFPYVDLVEAVPVLTSSETFVGGTHVNTWSYRYTEAVSHRQGKGFCGFAKIQSYDSFGHTQTAEYDPCMYGVVKSSKSADKEITYEYADLTGSNKIAKVNLSKKVEKDLLKGFTSTTLYPSYNSYGYPLKEETTYSDGSSVKNEYTYTSKETAEDGYSLGQLIISNTTVSSGGDTYVEKAHIPAHSKRLPYVKVNYKDGNQVSQHTYSYDPHGNVLRDAVKYYTSSTSLNTEYTYDANGRLTKTTDPTGLTESYAYNSKGQMVSLTDCRGGKTTFGYDAFGRSISVSYPDSTSRTVEYKWATDAGALYAIITKQTGRPDSTIYYDALNREVRCMEKRMDGALKRIDKRYDNRGNLWKVSLPDKTNEPSIWNEFEYDQYGRMTKSKEATGKTTTYTYSGNAATENDGKTTTTRKYDVFGNLISLTDASGTASYEYAADGQLSKTTVHGNIVTSIGYDKYRRQTSLTDPSLGEVTYTYDTSGNLASQTDADGRTVNYEYDNYNRLKKKTCDELTSTYTYDTYGSLASVTADNGTSTAYTYDSHGRISEMHEKGLVDVWLKTNYVYSAGNISAAVYTSAKGKLATEKYYYANGHLKEIILNEETVVYRLNGENSYGQQTWIQTGPLTRKYVQTGFALPHNRMAYTSTDTLQNQGYVFDPKTSNMLSRTDNIRGITESFAYDSQNRLTKFGNTSVSYDAKGNIQSKGDVGSFTYGLSGKPYAVSGVTLTESGIPSCTQEISYTSFSRPASINEGDVCAEFDYNSDGDRVRMKVTKDGMKYMTRNYLGGRYESEISGTYLYERLYIGGDSYSAPVVIERTSFAMERDTVVVSPGGPLEPINPFEADISDAYGTNASSSGPEIAIRFGTKVYYLLRDCLGSVTHIVSSDGKLVQELSYDAWGRLRNPQTHEVYAADKQPSPKFGRGYTGHEHLPQFGLINMNARLYDPVLGRFLSPDPNVQAPEWLQNFNRYTYAMNNPLCYVDKDGEFFWFIVGAAALVGGISNVAIHWNEIQATGGWKGFWRGAAYFGIGAGAGAIGACATIGASAWVGSMLAMTSISTSSITYSVLHGALVGATNGFAEGFLLHTSNSLMHGENFRRSIHEGLIGGGFDAALGCISGGVTGYMKPNNSRLNPQIDSEKKKYAGYLGYQDDIVKYAGITGREPEIRFGEHLNSGTERALLSYQVVAYFNTKIEARIWEQTQILRHGMQKLGGFLLNKRNELAKKYWKRYGIQP